LFSSIGFIPPLFVTYFLLLGGFLLTKLVFSYSKRQFKKTGLIILVIFVTNSYWLLPVAHFTFTRKNIYLNSTNNQLSTQNFNLKSQDYGDWQDVFLLRGFMLDTVDLKGKDRDQQFYIMDSIRKAAFSKKNIVVGNIIFTLILVGLIISVYKRFKLGLKEKDFLLWALVPSFIVLFSALAQNLPPFSWLSAVFKKIPIINQSFRASFTKVSTVLSLLYALFFAYGLAYVIKLICSKIKSVSKIIFLLMVGVVVWSQINFFHEEFIFDRLQTNIPNDYFQIFNYFKEQPKDARVLFLPFSWHWGWNMYDWGYTGSGFIWYGLEQPFVHRSFDVWSNFNEELYLQLNQVISQQNAELFYQYIQKYNIKYLLIDENVLLSQPYKKNFVNLKVILDSQDWIQKEAQFGQIAVWLVKPNEKYSELKGYANLPLVSQSESYKSQDLAYQNLGPYVQVESSRAEYLYPFSFFSSQRDIENKFVINDGILSAKTVVDEIDGEWILNIPPYHSEKIGFDVMFIHNNDQNYLKLKTVVPKLFARQQNVLADRSIVLKNIEIPMQADSVKINQEMFLLPKLSENEQRKIGNIDLEQDTSLNIQFLKKESGKNFLELNVDQKVTDCWHSQRDYSVSGEIDQGQLRLNSTNALACIPLKLGESDDSYLFEMIIKYQTENEIKTVACIEEQGRNKTTCKNRVVQKQFLSRNLVKEVHQTDILGPGIYWLNIRGVDSFNQDQPTEINYQQIVLNQYQLIGDYEIESQNLEEVYSGYSILLKN
ncbi:MAG: hypothetical protein U9O78_03745, partial [Patescibacteria group bacterium]|nr:hypothetical protein [Patescibacteria group bacterium]